MKTEECVTNLKSLDNAIKEHGSQFMEGMISDIVSRYMGEGGVTLPNLIEAQHEILDFLEIFRPREAFDPLQSFINTGPDYTPQHRDEDTDMRHKENESPGGERRGDGGGQVRRDGRARDFHVPREGVRRLLPRANLRVLLDKMKALSELP